MFYDSKITVPKGKIITWVNKDSTFIYKSERHFFVKKYSRSGRKYLRTPG